MTLEGDIDYVKAFAVIVLVGAGAAFLLYGWNRYVGKRIVSLGPMNTPGLPAT